MKLLWGRNHGSIVLVAETAVEVALCEMFLEGMSYHRYAETHKGKRVIGAKYTVTPEESKE